MQAEVLVLLSVFSAFSRHPAARRASGGTVNLFTSHAGLIVPGILQLLPALSRLRLCIFPWDTPFGDLSRVEAGWPSAAGALGLLFWWDCAREEPPSPESQDILLAAEDEENGEAKCREAEVRDYAPPVLD